jgi:hypothetical protein
MVASTAEWGILELARFTYSRAYPIFLRSNPSPEVIFFRPYFNVGSRFLGFYACGAAFLNRFSEILFHAHGIFTSKELVMFFVKV